MLNANDSMIPLSLPLNKKTKIQIANDPADHAQNG
jgi:hypothetical protein